MKNIAKILLAVALAGTALQAFAGPSPEYWQRMDASRKRTTTAPAKPEPLCAICAELAKQPNPTAKVIRGRTYDPKLSCHRSLKSTALPTGKSQSFSWECVCS
jgi:hypothetical protein